MRDKERISREITIANRTYPIKIYKQDEDSILQIVKSINFKIEQLKSQYDAKDNQDYLAMSILQLYTLQNQSESSTDLTEFDIELTKIESVLSAVSLD